MHIRKSGINRVRASDNARRRLPDQIRKIGKEQTYRPRKSPMLNTRKWIEVNNRGCVSGFTGRMEVVIGGKTACG